MDRGPDFRELVGEKLGPEERERLERVHELLVAAGPPPELPPQLAKPPDESAPVVPMVLPRRRAGALLALAAAIALIAFLGGFVAGKKGVGQSSMSVFHSVSMHGTAPAQNASATIDIGTVDSSGNWPMKVVVRGLPQLSKGSYYEMFLTNHGKPTAACGIFTVSGSTSTVHLTMPPTITGYNGWIVTRETPGRPHQVVLTT